jgi:hypothetical protein
LKRRKPKSCDSGYDAGNDGISQPYDQARRRKPKSCDFGYGDSGYDGISQGCDQGACVHASGA